MSCQGKSARGVLRGLLGTLAALTMAAALFCACARKAETPADVPKAVAAAETREEPDAQRFSCVAKTDGLTLSCRVTAPTAAATPAPLLLVLPDTPIETTTLTGRAFVAELDDWRPQGCPEWIRQADYGTVLEELCRRLPIDRERVYLAARDREGVAFACAETQRFAGLYLVLTERLSSSCIGLPWRNLLNLPVFLDKSPLAADRVPAPAAELERLLGNAARGTLLKSSECAGAPQVASAFDWLQMQNTTHRILSWDLRVCPTSPLWWLQLTEENFPAKGIVTAALREDSAGRKVVTIASTPLKRFAIRNDWAGFRGKRTIVKSAVDGRILGGIRTDRPGWTLFERDEVDHTWRISGTAEELRADRQLVRGPLRRVLARPVLLVVGTALPSRTELWRAAARRFADEWESRTGVRPLQRDDVQVTAEDLDGRNPILFGSPADNTLSALLLEDEDDFLTRLYRLLPENDRQDDMLAVATLCPPDRLAPEGSVAMLLANGDEAIPDSWELLLEDPRGDYLMKSPTLHRTGSLEE